MKSQNPLISKEILWKIKLKLKISKTVRCTLQNFALNHPTGSPEPHCEAGSSMAATFHSKSRHQGSPLLIFCYWTQLAQCRTGVSREWGTYIRSDFFSTQIKPKLEKCIFQISELLTSSTGCPMWVAAQTSARLGSQEVRAGPTRVPV